MPTLRNDVERKALLERLGRVTAESKAQWGRFDAPRMMCHLADALDEALGRLVVPRHGPAMLRHFPMKQLAIYLIPMPKGAKAAPELLAEEPGDFEANRRRVTEAIRQIAQRAPGKGPNHFIFGAMSWEQWNRLEWKHIDHHLRQFDC